MEFKSKSGKDFEIKLIEKGKAQFVMGSYKHTIKPSDVVIDGFQGLSYIEIYFVEKNIKDFPKELQPTLRDIYEKDGGGVVHLKVALTREVAEEIKDIIESHLAEWEEASKQDYVNNLKNNKSLYIGIGGDTMDLYVSFFDIDVPDSVSARAVASRLSSIWCKRIEYYRRKHNISVDDLAKICEKSEYTTGLYNVLYPDGTWGRIPLGSDFLKQAKKEYRAYRREQKQKIKQRKGQLEKELQEKRQNAIQKAKETGKPVAVRVLGQFDGDDYNQVKLFAPELLKGFGELGVVTVYEVAEPDGTIHQVMSPRY